MKDNIFELNGNEQELLKDIGFEYEESCNAWFYKPLDEYIENHKELDGFCQLGIIVMEDERFDEFLRRAIKYVMKSSIDLTVEYQSIKLTDMVRRKFNSSSFTEDN